MKRFKFAFAMTVSSACAFVSLAKTTNLTESVVLSKDTDWRGQGVVLMDQGGAIDLGGHALWTDGISSPEKVDVTEPDADGTHVTTSALSSGTGAVLFDNDFSYRMYYTAAGEYNFDTNKNHRVLGSGVSASNPLWVAYDFKTATCIRGYKIHFQSSSSSDRAPKAWVFEGSNDNDTWTVLEERADVTGWKSPESRLFAFSNETPFRHYRLKISSAVSGSYVEFYQLEFFGVSSVSADTDLTTADATRAFTPRALQDGTAATLFDNRFTSASHRILVNGSNYFPARFGYDFGKATSVSAYRIYYHSTYSGDPSYGGAVRSPRAWTFEGTDDTNANNWTVLDRRDNAGNSMGWQNPDVRTFDVANPGIFRYYRLNIEGPVSLVALELYQLEFLGHPAVRSNPTSPVYGFDLTTADASKVSLSPSSALRGGTVTALFDNQFVHTAEHRALMSEHPFEVIYDFDTPKTVKGYRIYYANSDTTDSGKNNRAPKTWRLKGSNDKTNWTVVDGREDYVEWAIAKDMRFFAVSAPGSYRYYCLEVLEPVSGGYTELYQLEYFPTSGTEVHDLTTDASNASTGSTLYSGNPAVLFDNDFSYRANTSSSTLFDTNANHRVLVLDANLPLTIDYDFRVPTVVNGYKIYFNSSGGDAPNRAPKNWTFEGADDPAGPWTVLDAHAGVTGWTKGGANCYFFANVNAYRHYRLNFTAVNGSNLELYQLEYFNRPAGELHLDVSADAVISNCTVALEGAVKLVKEGEGTFVAARENQGYFGGTDVDAGTLRAGADGASAPLGMKNGSTASSGSAVTVSAGGVFDIGGFGGWSNYPIVLNGGKLVCNSGAGVMDTFRNISQTAASSIEIPSAFVMGDGTGGGALDLGGCELDVNLVNGGSWTIGLPVVSNGKLVTLVNGQETPPGTKLASWDEKPSFNDVKLYHAQAREDGLYSYRSGSVIIFR